MMRDTGIKNCHWLQCTGLWIDENAIEGQAERMREYELNAKDLANRVCN